MPAKVILVPSFIVAVGDAAAGPRDGGVLVCVCSLYAVLLPTTLYVGIVLGPSSNLFLLSVFLFTIGKFVICRVPDGMHLSKINH